MRIRPSLHQDLSLALQALSLALQASCQEAQLRLQHDNPTSTSGCGRGYECQRSAPVKHSRSSHYKYGKQTVVVPGRLVLLSDVELVSGVCAGKLLPFLSEVQVVGDPVAWLVVCRVYVANPDTQHGHRVLVVAVNPESALAGTYCPTSLTARRDLSAPAKLSKEACDAAEAVDHKLRGQARAKAKFEPKPEPIGADAKLGPGQRQRKPSARASLSASSDPDDVAEAAASESDRKTTSRRSGSTQGSSKAQRKIASLERQVKGLRDQLKKAQQKKDRNRHVADAAAGSATQLAQVNSVSRSVFLLFGHQHLIALHTTGEQLLRPIGHAQKEARSDQRAGFES